MTNDTKYPAVPAHQRHYEPGGALEPWFTDQDMLEQAWQDLDTLHEDLDYFCMQMLADADLLMEAGREIDRYKTRTANQRRELRRLNKLVHEHTSRSISAGLKAQSRGVAVQRLERENARLQKQLDDALLTLRANGIQHVPTY